MKKNLLFLFFIFSIASGISFAQKQKTLCSPPTVTMSSNVTICNGQSASITASGSATTPAYTYDWTPNPAGNLSSYIISNPVASPTTTTTYTCLVTDGVACTNTGTVTVTVNPTPTITISGGGSICSGTSATLTASGGSTYSWNTSATSTSIIVTPTAQTSYTVWGTSSLVCTSTATTTVSFFPNPTASISGTLTICNGTSTTLTGAGGGTYSWAPGGLTTTSISVNPTTNTNYTVTVTNGNGCTDTDVATVAVNPTPTVTIGGSGSICSNTSTTLTASGGSTYSWNTGATTTSITVSPTSATTYTVWGTNGFSCTNTATGTVDIHPDPVAAISGNTTICNGQTTTLTATGGVSYSWNTGALTPVITDNPTSTTFYTVQVTDGNGCTDLATQAVTVNPLPTANAGPDVSICVSSSTTLNATGNGSFVWTPSTGLSNTTIANPVANHTATITYTVTVTNSCGSTVDSVKVTINALPSVNAGADVTICLGGNASLVASGSGTYAWLPGGGLSCTNCANPIANPTVTTNYTVTITDICGSASDSVWVVISNPSTTISGNSPICEGQSSTLSATGGGGYAWSTGGTTSSIVVSPTSTTGYTVTITNGLGCTDTDVMTVTVNPLPTPAISGDATICAGVSDTLVATGGTSYSWNTGVTNDTLIVNPTSATGYTVTVTDGNGCSNTASFSVSTNPQPLANAGTDVTICNGSSTTLNAAGNGSYVWTPSAGLSNPNISNPVANPTSTTNYTVAVTNSCGTATDVVVVNVDPVPSAAISGNDTICTGSGSTLTASGGTGYAWSTGGTTSSIVVSPTTGTNYTVTVTGANGCTNSSTFSVTVSSVAPSISGTTSLCSGQSSTLTASGGVSYSWITGSTSTSIVVAPTTGTSYTVIATNAFGCTGAATVSMTITPQPTASVTATTSTICTGSASTLTASGGTTYVWSPTTGLSNINISNPVATPTSATTYTVTVSNGACSSTATITIGVNPVPTASVSATAASICVGGCVSLTASGASTYAWAPGGQTAAVISECPTIATTYTVTATDANGCTDNATTLINVLPPVNLLLSGDTTICANSPTILTAQGGSSYTWNTGATTSSITVNPPSSTTYTVISSNGACADTATISVTAFSLPTALATANPYSINFGSQTTLTGTTSTGTWNWSPTTGLSCGACQNPVADPTVTTTYTLTTTDANGCTAIDTVIVVVNMDCDNFFVPTAFSPNGDMKNDVFKVRDPCVQEIELTIYNRWGQKVFYTTDPAEGWDGKVNGGREADPAVFFYTLYVKKYNNTVENLQGNVTLIR